MFFTFLNYIKNELYEYDKNIGGKEWEIWFS